MKLPIEKMLHEGPHMMLDAFNRVKLDKGTKPPADFFGKPREVTDTDVKYDPICIAW